MVKSFHILHFCFLDRHIPDFLDKIGDQMFSGLSAVNYNLVKSCPATRHEGPWGRGGIARTHS
jgi:hypothetical protein